VSVSLISPKEEWLACKQLFYLRRRRGSLAYIKAQKNYLPLCKMSPIT
jgi:hypothetical protein